MMKPLVQLLLVALLTFASAAKVQADKMPARLPSLTEAAEAAGNLDALLMVIEQLGYEQYLLEASSITVFAFTDEAFQALYPSMRESLFSPGNEDLLSDFLVYHIVPDTITAAEVPTAETQVITLRSGALLTLSSVNGSIQVNDASVMVADIEIANGVLHILDRVLLF
jgi:uncharacterized surface protein with fasciclin (FAS1) repeats